MLRRTLLAIVLLVVGLALVNGVVVHHVPAGYVPDDLLRADRALSDRYVDSETSVAAGVFGFGLVLAALLPMRTRLWANMAILYGMITVGMHVYRYYYGGESVLLRPIAVWAAVTALMMLMYPVRLGSRGSASGLSIQTNRPWLAELTGRSSGSSADDDMEPSSKTRPLSTTR